MQYRLVRAWNRDRDELFVIGDPDQAIYSFRGSDPRCFETLARDCPDGRVIRLNENYRSTPQILDCALPVIASGLPPQEARNAPAGGYAAGWLRGPAAHGRNPVFRGFVYRQGDQPDGGRHRHARRPPAGQRAHAGGVRAARLWRYRGAVPHAQAGIAAGGAFKKRASPTTWPVGKAI